MFTASVFVVTTEQNYHDENWLYVCTYAKKTFLVAQMVKNLPATWETQVWFLGWEHPLERGIATHSSTPAWRIPQTEEPGGLQSRRSQRVRHDWVTNTFTFMYVYTHSCILIDLHMSMFVWWHKHVWEGVAYSLGHGFMKGDCHDSINYINQ